MRAESNPGSIAIAPDRLLDWFRPHRSALVAFSGGVDSSLLAKVAFDALGERSLAVTAVSASLAPVELEGALRVARTIGVRHQTVRSGELDNPDYLENDADRCYHCKSELYRLCRQIASEQEIEVIVDGLNRDDLGDHRPGARAAVESGARSPFVELGLDKNAIRSVSRSLGLPTAEKAEMACLASRIPTGTPITEDRLARVARAEEELALLGFRQYRVRLHGDLARIEVPEEEIAGIAKPEIRRLVVERVTAAGFRFVTIDLAGYRRGSTNALALL